MRRPHEAPAQRWRQHFETIPQLSAAFPGEWSGRRSLERSFCKLKQPSRTLRAWQTKGQTMKSSMTNQPCLPGRKMRNAWLGLIPALAILCLAAGSESGSITSSDEPNAPKLEGTWEAAVTLHFGDGTTLELPAKAPVSHATGGVTIISDPNVLLPPPVGAPTTPFQGAWTKKGGEEFAFQAVFYQYSDGALYKGTLKENVTMKGPNRYEGAGTIVWTQLDGTVVLTYGTTTKATRLQPE